MCFLVLTLLRQSRDLFVDQALELRVVCGLNGNTLGRGYQCPRNSQHQPSSSIIENNLSAGLPPSDDLLRHKGLFSPRVSHGHRPVNPPHGRQAGVICVEWLVVSRLGEDQCTDLVWGHGAGVSRFRSGPFLRWRVCGGSFVLPVSLKLNRRLVVKDGGWLSVSVSDCLSVLHANTQRTDR